MLGRMPAWSIATYREARSSRHYARRTIASSLGMSVETVKTHVVNAKDKLGAGDRTQLAVMALLYGLIDPLG